MRITNKTNNKFTNKCLRIKAKFKNKDLILLNKTYKFQWNIKNIKIIWNLNSKHLLILKKWKIRMIYIFNNNIKKMMNLIKRTIK